MKKKNCLVHCDRKFTCTLTIQSHATYIRYVSFENHDLKHLMRSFTQMYSLSLSLFYGKGKQSKACWWTSLFSESGKATLCVLMHVCKVYLLHYCVHVGVNSFIHLTLTMGKQCGPLSLTIKKEEKKINIQTMTYIFP